MESKTEGTTTDSAAPGSDAGVPAIAPDSSRSRGVFVVGCPRSGTSVLSWALAQHPDFWTSSESDYLLTLFGRNRLYGIYKEAYDRTDGSWLRKEKVSFAEFMAKMGLGPEMLFTSRAGGRRWVDGTPLYTLMINELFCLFPSASFLHIVRDGRAVVNSMISSGFDTRWASDFTVACETWVHYVQLGHSAVQAYPERVCEVRYEALTGNPRSEVSRVFEFLGEQSFEGSVELIATRRINSSYGNVHPGDVRKAKDPHDSPKRPWEEWTAEQKSIFASVAREAMTEFGYWGDEPTSDGSEP